MKRISLIAISAILLAACGDEVTQIQTGLEIYSAESDLPECTAKNEGDQAVIKGETSIRVCLDGDWTAMNSEGSGADFSCKTEELNDGSGLKIVCNGDSIGVVLNGEKGEAGKAGKDGENGQAGTGCAMTDRTESTITVVCGDSTMVIELGVGATADTAEADSERVPISLDSIVGLTQKGPFLKGSTVYLYELSDGRTLKQTNGNFTSNISQENGRYKFLARDLVSQYAMVIVDGYYRNEVTGLSSNAPIRLKAITDMRKRSSVNVNILTHLEFERVYYLVTKEKYTVKHAKRKAQREILNFFGINLDGKADAEDMDVFGSSDADAALLAVSILLQGDRTESEMMALLSEMSSAMATDSVWNNDRAKALKAELADWAFGQLLPKFRKNVEGWHLGDGKVGDFEKYINNFIATTFGIDTCGSSVNTKAMPVTNPQSRFYRRSYACLQPDYLVGMTFTHPDWIEIRSENPYLNPVMYTEDASFKYYQMIDMRDRKVYTVIEYMAEMDDYTAYFNWMAENLDFDYRVNGESYGTDCYRDDCLSDSSRAFGRYYSWAAAMDSAGLYSTDGAGCGSSFKLCNVSNHVRGVCPEGWHLPKKEDIEILLDYVAQDYPDDAPGLALRSKNAWTENPISGYDELGLSFVPSGTRQPNTSGKFAFVGSNFFMWTSTQDAVEGGYANTLNVADEPRSSYKYKTEIFKTSAGLQYSVRCVQDGSYIEYYED